MAGERAAAGGFTSHVQPEFVPFQGSGGPGASALSVNTENTTDRLFLKTAKGEGESAALNSAVCTTTKAEH